MIWTLLLVSRIISGLEDEIGVRLFHRTTRTMSLTEEGENYLKRVELIFSELKQVTDEAQIASGKPKGVIRITSSVAFAEKKLIPLLLKFKQTYPDLKPELILTDENLDLTTNRIDLALRLAEGIEGDYVVSRLQTTKYHVCAAPSYLDQHSEVSQPNDLSKHECLVFSMPEFRSSWFFQDSSGNVDETEITPGIIISNALALRKAALAGLGPALLGKSYDRFSTRKLNLA